MVQLTQPYIAGFLAFREVDFIVALVAKLRDRHPSMQPQVQHTTCAPLCTHPQVIFVDGNGVLHHRGLGQASHLGILLDTPTVQSVLFGITLVTLGRLASARTSSTWTA